MTPGQAKGASERGGGALDPVTGATYHPAPNREPAFVIPGREEAAAVKMAEFRSRAGRRPNMVVILMDDVGWGDFGCYGGGVAVGAPTPNVDRIARDGLLLTSCYSEPSCTPTRASIMTGRLPMRHGLLVPPMYGMPGGLSGEVTLPQLLSDAGYVTQAVGKWHMGENSESQPQNVGFDDFYGFLSVSDMYTEWRDPYFFPEIVYSEDRTEWVHNMPFNKCFVHAARNGPLEEVEEVTVPVLSLLDSKWCTYSEQFIERMAGVGGPLVPLPLHPGGALRQLPPPRLPRTLPGSAPLQGRRRRAGRHLRPAGRRARADGPARVDHGCDLVRQRAGDGDLARLRLHAVSLRQGIDLGGRGAGACRRVLAGDDRAGTEQRRPRAPPRSLRHLPVNGRAPWTRCPVDRYIDAVDQLSFLLAVDDREAVSNRKYQHYWLTSQFSALRVGEYKYMLSSISDDDSDVLNPGGFTGVVQRYGYGRLYNLYLDPKETRSYMIRKLVYIDAIIGEIARHQATFREWPNKPTPVTAS